jgi:hypothetical protein
MPGGKGPLRSGRGHPGIILPTCVAPSPPPPSPPFPAPARPPPAYAKVRGPSVWGGRGQGSEQPARSGRRGPLDRHRLTASSLPPAHCPEPPPSPHLSPGRPLSTDRPTPTPPARPSSTRRKACHAPRSITALQPLRASSSATPPHMPPHTARRAPGSWPPGGCRPGALPRSWRPARHPGRGPQPPASGCRPTSPAGGRAGGRAGVHQDAHSRH